MFNIRNLITHILEGLAVAVAIYLIPSKKMEWKYIITIALTVTAMFLILDAFSPQTSMGMRQGAGFGIGFQQIGLGRDELSS